MITVPDPTKTLTKHTAKCRYIRRTPFIICKILAAFKSISGAERAPAPLANKSQLHRT